MKFPLVLVQLKTRLSSYMSKLEILLDSQFDLSTLDNEVIFDISNKNASLYLFNIKEDNKIHFELKNDTVLHLSIFANSPIKNAKITANVGRNSRIITYFADFSTDSNKTDVDINLNEEGAECEWHLASLSSGHDNKEIGVSIYHNHASTFGRIDNYGVCKDHAKLLFSGISHILKGCHQSSSHQNAKIVVFDNDCIARAKPILKIDENDIQASHAATVGKVSDEHIFYLTSRGLNIDEAKMLITLGYLKPILKGFNPEIANQIDQIIEGRLY